MLEDSNNSYADRAQEPLGDSDSLIELLGYLDGILGRK